MKKITAIMLAFAVAFTTLPALTGQLDSHAASQYWKKFKVEAGSPGEYATALTWSKLTKAQQKKISGITVFRNGKAIKNLKKGATKFYDSKIQEGKSYTYQLKTYKKTTKKVKMYFNNKTGKWQTKKIKGAKTKKAKKTTYKYKNGSGKKTVTIEVYDEDDDEDTGDESQDTGSQKPEPVVKPEKTYVKVTDYEGAVRRFTEGREELTDPRYNRNIDGSFFLGKKGERTYYFQKNGTTVSCSENDAGSWVYNGDVNKLSVEIDRPIVRQKKWKPDLVNPGYEWVDVVYGDHGRVLAEVELQKGQGIRYFFYEKYWDSGVVNYTVKYDGELIYQGSRAIPADKECYDDHKKYDGYGFTKYKCYLVAKAGVDFYENGGETRYLSQENFQRYKVKAYGNERSGEYYAHMKAVEAYVRANYTYSQFDCWWGASILEAYSVLEYGIYGHICWSVPSNPSHHAFRPDYCCEQGMYDLYFQTQGMKDRQK